MSYGSSKDTHRDTSSSTMAMLASVVLECCHISAQAQEPEGDAVREHTCRGDRRKQNDGRLRRDDDNNADVMVLSSTLCVSGHYCPAAVRCACSSLSIGSWNALLHRLWEGRASQSARVRTPYKCDIAVRAHVEERHARLCSFRLLVLVEDGSVGSGQM